MLKTVWLVGLCLYGALDAERQAWTRPDERLRSTPLLPALRADEFGPDSPYRLLLAAGDIPDSCLEVSDLHWSPQRILALWQKAEQGRQTLAAIFGQSADVPPWHPSEREARRYCASRLALVLLTGRTPEDTRRGIVAVVSRAAALADLPYRAETAKALADLDRLAPEFRTTLRHPLDPSGFAQAASSMSGANRLAEQHALRAARLRGTALLFALRAYQYDTGRLPERLADLVPDYLPAVPEDPFDGRSFRYIQGRTPPSWQGAYWGVYSVGTNFVDDGGAWNQGKAADPGKSPDLVFVLTAPRP